MNTQFQYSRKRSQSQPGLQSGLPQPTSGPWSKYSSEHGPHGPVGPARQKLSSSPRREIWSSATPRLFQISMVSSSSSNTVKYRRSSGSSSTSVENSSAQAHISFLKYLPKLKLPSISKKLRRRPVVPMMSMSLVRTHFCTVVVPT